MAKRFRKVFIVCKDNQVFGNIGEITIYNEQSQAEFASNRAKIKAVEEQQKMWNKGKPMPVFKVHAFYLVHEEMFKE